MKSFSFTKKLNLSKNVIETKNFIWQRNNQLVWSNKTKLIARSSRFLKIIVLDFGCKNNILNILSEYGCSILLISDNIKTKDIYRLQPDGLLLSNGPGDPKNLLTYIKIVKNLLIDKKVLPIFGICMGHQITGLASGANTFKLKFGHRGLNHPTGNTQRIEITSQNHGFAVDSKSFKNLANDTQITHLNLNDQTLAGISYTSKPIFSVQYHPEASPGPHDSYYLFDQFISTIKYISLFS